MGSNMKNYKLDKLVSQGIIKSYSYMKKEYGCFSYNVLIIEFLSGEQLEVESSNCGSCESSELEII